MTERRLREVLDELHQELERSDSIDDETRALLRDARSDIEEALVETPEKASSARGRLGEALERFEGEHPDAVALIQRVLDALSNVGI